MYHVVDTDTGTRLYSTDEAAARTGLTYRQLDYLARTGVHTPHHPADGSGNPRRYTDHDLAVLTAIGRLRHLGAPRHILERAAALLTTHPDHWPPCLILTRDGHQLEHATDPHGCWVLPLHPTSGRCCAA